MSLWVHAYPGVCVEVRRQFSLLNQLSPSTLGYEDESKLLGLCGMLFIAEPS